MSQRIQFRRGTAAAWTTANPILASGEPGRETDTGKIKVGDGVTAWTALPYYRPPFLGGARCYTSASQTIGSGGWVVINYDVESFDTDGFHSTSVNPQRWTVPAGMAGKYEFKATLSYSLNGTGFRFISLMKNGTTRSAVTNLPAADGSQFRTRVACEDVFDLAVGDYVHVEGFQNSAATLQIGDTTPSGGVGETWAALTYLGA